MSENNQKEKQIELILDDKITLSSKGIRIKATSEMSEKGINVNIYLKREFLKVFDESETNLGEIFERNKFTIETIVNDKFHKLGEPGSLEMEANDTVKYIL